GIAGLGTVGVGVVRALTSNAALISHRTGRFIEITSVSARDKARGRGVPLHNYAWYDDPVDMAKADDVDIVVELIGGDSGPSKELCETALKNGKSVVTANKALIAHHGTALTRLAEENNTALRFEGAVAGGIPVIKAISQGLIANRLSRIYGILNGTCNYILTSMEDTGRDFGDILTEAQALGYAEADPTFDVDGTDSAHKLAILASIAFGTEVNFSGVYTEGIEGILPLDIDYARELGYRIKLLGIATYSDGGVEQRVHPCLIDKSSPIALVDGVFNAVVAEGDFIGETMFQGPGAGEGATASAVVSDIADVAQGNFHPAFSAPPDWVRYHPFLTMDEHEGRYYVRLSVKDEKGVMASITAILSDEDVSMEALIQRSRLADDAVTVVMTTHETVEANMKRALARLEELDFTIDKPAMIRIEEF
ncbi:MAG: homoserine dehydrogenase, partial [Alphaproteobacteria bacterium]|nr:homoserine dehydrogenase [Alphaproteobacteria bacterium]